MNEQITQLLDLQRLDQQCADLSTELSRADQQKEHLERKREKERTDFRQLEQRLRQLEHDSRLKNLEVDDLDMQIREYRKQLDEGIISYKEMEALRVKIAHQRERISNMEDAALDLMDDIERMRLDLQGAQLKLERTEKDLDTQFQQIEAHIAQLMEEKKIVEAERGEIAAQTTRHLLNRYETLRDKYADPVVGIVKGICSGCKLKVSANTVERTRDGSEIVQCENCSRILYIR